MTKSSNESKSTPASGGALQKPSRRKIFGGGTKLKSFKGFITGKSRRERRASSSKALSLSPTEDSTASVPEPIMTTVPSVDSRVNDDMETVYGMELDNASSVSEHNAHKVADGPSRASSTGIDIVLLLMDNETRRFELLQVDLDSPTARVKDILVKIPDHATEPSLKFQTFGIVCDRHGQIMDTEKSLADFFTVLADTSNAHAHTFLLLAVTSKNNDLKGADCAKLAKPILTHSKIAKMLLTLGVEEEDASKEILQDHGIATKEPKSPTPIKYMPERIPSTPETVVATPSSTTEEDFIAPSKSRKASSTSSLLIFALFFGLVSTILYSTLVQVHTLYSTAPLSQPGHILAPGSWRSQCGLFHLLPTKVIAEVKTPFESVNTWVSSLLYRATSPVYCPASTTLSVHMSKNGTLLQVYRDSQVIYALVGKSCSPSSTSTVTVLQSFLNSTGIFNETTTDCVPGAKVSETGSIEIGGQPPLYAILYDKEKSSSIFNDLQSWPFGENIILHRETFTHLKNKPVHHISQNKPKPFAFPWKDIKIVLPWEKNQGMKEPTSHSKSAKDFKFPWENIKIVWPWEKK